MGRGVWNLEKFHQATLERIFLQDHGKIPAERQ
jgi:hypothetical protein